VIAQSADSTRDRLLRTAFRLFHEQGFHATGIATVLREADVNPGSLYHVFASKDALLLGVLEFALDFLRPAVMDPVEAREADPIGRVFALLDQYRAGMAHFGCRMGCPMGNLALEVSDDKPDARALIHRNFENWADQVEAWLNAAGDRLPKDCDRRSLARFVLTVMEGGLMQARAAGNLEPFDASVNELRRYFEVLQAAAKIASKAKSRQKKLRPTKPLIRKRGQK
jgi:TetR/AcrR family transcriptional regulator, transcriptional repressor for nem operon